MQITVMSACHSVISMYRTPPAPAARDDRAHRTASPRRCMPRRLCMRPSHSPAPAARPLPPPRARPALHAPRPPPFAPSPLASHHLSLPSPPPRPHKSIPTLLPPLAPLPLPPLALLLPLCPLASCSGVSSTMQPGTCCRAGDPTGPAAPPGVPWWWWWRAKLSWLWWWLLWGRGGAAGAGRASAAGLKAHSILRGTYSKG